MSTKTDSILSDKNNIGDKLNRNLPNQEVVK